MATTARTQGDLRGRLGAQRARQQSADAFISAGRADARLTFSRAGRGAKSRVVYRRGRAAHCESERRGQTKEALLHHFLSFFGTSFMPQIGQLPGSLRWISGCMGQV